MIRNPVFSGVFYPSSALKIKSILKGFLPKVEVAKTEAIGCILPHAGYIYSGKVAALTLSQIDIPERVVLFGPNHTGLGAPFSLMPKGVWGSPLGDIRIDSDLAELILRYSRHIKEDYLAHAKEHSLEVELPVIQYFKNDFEIVPIAFLSDNLDILIEEGVNIAKAIKDYSAYRVLLVASSDMTHYEPEAKVKDKDNQAIEAILSLDEKKLMERVASFNITMCGYAPVIAMLSCVKELGASKGKLVAYQTSAETSNDKSSVVGYAGIILN
jgi:MEMO1 family protein